MTTNKILLKFAKKGINLSPEAYNIVNNAENPLDFTSSLIVKLKSDKYSSKNLRMVLLKFFDTKDFAFFTNYGSRKAQDIAGNQEVALLFPWVDLARQVIITGPAAKVSAMESARYFASRPRGSQLGAWVSHQSAVISSRQLLLQQFDKLKQKFVNAVDRKSVV